MASNSLDETTLSTLALLEPRLLRVEHLLHGQTGSPSPRQNEPAMLQMANLERRFSALLSRVRVYAELLKIYKSHPDFFHAPPASEPPSQLSSDAILAIVLSSASAFPSTLSSLTAIKDSPIPDPSESASLIALAEKMKVLEATQMAQAAAIAELRARSEAVIRTWYESSVLSGSQFMAEVEDRVEKVERRVRRAEHDKEAEEAV